MKVIFRSSCEVVQMAMFCRIIPEIKAKPSVVPLASRRHRSPAMRRDYRPLKVTLWQQIAAAAPALVPAIIFIWPLVFDESYLFGTDRVSLGRVMQIEFLAMASGLFLLMPLLVPTVSKRGHVLRIFLFLAVGWAFATVSHHYDGWRGIVCYVILVIMTYGGGTLFMSDVVSRDVLAILAAARWIVWLAFFLPLIVWFDLGEGNISRWAGKLATIRLGATFFTIVFLLEFFLFSWASAHVDAGLERRRAREAAVDAQLETRARFARLLRGSD